MLKGRENLDNKFRHAKSTATKKATTQFNKHRKERGIVPHFNLQYNITHNKTVPTYFFENMNQTKNTKFRSGDYAALHHRLCTMSSLRDYQKNTS
ncbi:MAG: hypothetical protein LBQ66_01740 [Planctomycetaceae bacterium]|jgi:hypothetical protein|nr:hypothetical protein [Planctomycetaceae bacterium]